MSRRLPAGPQGPVNLFWSGGWDSTFRLLQLLLEYRLPVRTFYIVDPGRGTTGLEFRTMDDLRRHIQGDHPFTRALWGPTEVRELGSVRPDPVLERTYREARKLKPYGIQYEWLAKFTKQEGLRRPEIGITSGGSHPSALQPHSIQVKERGFATHRVSPKANGPIADLFRGMDLPLLFMNKADMERYAVRKGWMGFLERTWFCYHPTGGGRPCGICTPCCFTIDLGMGRRIPWDRRVLGAVARPLKAFVKRLLGRGPAPSREGF